MTRSAPTPNIFLFTDPAIGQEHGYYDGWVEDRFHYTGMGQRGDQQFTRANGAVLRHHDEGRSLRLFRGARGTVTYLGEFELDEATSYYRMDAPETGDGPIRQVIVFRLRPVGSVVHDPDDDLHLPAGLAPSLIEDAVRGGDEATLVEVPVEQQHTEHAVVNPSHETYEAERREQRLVLAYQEFLESRGSEVIRFRVIPPGEAKPLYADLYDKTRNNLVEAKGSGSRLAVRMAIGQLANYRRFLEPSPLCAVLLPERPRSDLETLLRSQGVQVVWADGEGFSDNADGRFT